LKRESLNLKENKLNLDSKNRDWRRFSWHFKNRLQDLYALRNILNFSKKEEKLYRHLISVYKFGVTPYYLSLAEEFDYSDPIFKQCIPSLEEILPSNHLFKDPLGEEKDTPVPGVVQYINILIEHFF